MMRRLIPYLLSVMIMPWCITLADVRVGDTIEQVVAELGHPKGVIDLPEGRQLLMFDRGNVHVQQGKVTRHALKDEATMRREQEIRQARQQAWEERQAFLREVRKARVDPPSFAELNPSEQLVILNQLLRDYPDIDVSVEYHAAAQKIQTVVDQQVHRAREEHNRQYALAQATRPRNTMTVGTYSPGPAWGCYGGYATGASVKAGYNQDGFYFTYTPRTLRTAFGGTPFCVPRRPVIIIPPPQPGGGGSAPIIITQQR